MNNLDLKLEAINTKVPFRSVWKESLGKMPSGFRLTAGLMIGIFVFFIIQLFFISQTKPLQPDILWAVLILFSIVFAVVSACVWRGYVNYRNFVVLSEIAKANNFQVIEKIDKPEQQYIGSLLKAGKNQPVYSILKGIWAKRSFEIFNLIYVTREGRSSTTNYTGIIVVKLPRRLPNIIFDNKSDNFLGISSLGNATPSSSQKVQLEGDFNKYFDVYVPKDYERDMLYFLTPELMQLLIEEGKEYDIEVIGDELYIYNNGMEFNFNDKDEFKSIFKLIESIGSEFSENTDSYKHQVSVAQSASVVNADPPKLKKSKNNLRYNLFMFSIFLITLLVLFIARITA